MPRRRHRRIPWIALHSVGSSASIENGNVRFWLFVATAMAPIGQVPRPMTPPKIDGRVGCDLDLDEPGQPDVATVDRRDVDVHDLIRIGIVEAVVDREATGGVLGLDLVGEDVASSGQGCGVSRVLLVASLDEHHPDVERECGDEEQRDEAPGEEDEDLPAFPGAASC